MRLNVKFYRIEVMNKDNNISNVVYFDNLNEAVDNATKLFNLWLENGDLEPDEKVKITDEKGKVELVLLADIHEDTGNLYMKMI